MLTAELREKFQQDGFVVLPNFLTETEVDALNNECKRIVDEMGPTPNSRFSSKTAQQLDDEYFLTSGDKIRFFFEEDAFDKEGNLKFDKQHSLNKIGHALHWLNPVFKKITFSDKVKDISKTLQMVEPVIIHSMYIFKPSNIGGAVLPHQDASYLYCEPEDKIIGLWIALDDATQDNGCLWFIPGSQSNLVQRRLLRKYTGATFTLTYTGPPQTYDKKDFVCVPAKKGDLILIHGKVVHKSEANKSSKSRPIYTFHILDRSQAEFSSLNWIQPSAELPFTPLYTEI